MEFLVLAIIVAILGALITQSTKKFVANPNVVAASFNRPSDRELTSRVASIIDAFIQQEGGAEFTLGRLFVIIHGDYTVSISDGRRTTTALVSVPLKDLNLETKLIEDNTTIRYMAVDLAAQYVLGKLQESRFTSVSEKQIKEEMPSPIFMIEVPHLESNTPIQTVRHGSKSINYYENPTTIGNIEAGIPSIYLYPQCAVIAEGQDIIKLVRVEQSDFGSMLCVLEPSGTRTNLGQFSKTTRELFLKRVVEIIG